VKLLDELAEWWPLFSASEDYTEEAALFAVGFDPRIIREEW